MANAQTNIMHRQIYRRIVEMTALVICSIAMIVEKQAIHLNAQLNNTFMTLVVMIFIENVSERRSFCSLAIFFYFFWHHCTTSSLW